MRANLIAVCLALPTLAWAVGGDDAAPPKPTPTTTECTGGQIWDADSKTCVAPKDARFDDDTLYDAARELAYAGQYGAAIAALQAMSDPQDDRVLTYLGFAHRKSGDHAAGMAYYRQALARNPDNLLARSYMGQAFVETSDVHLARAELREIRARGGRMTWAWVSLDQAIRSGRGVSY
ncbi:tetratricopeptide repeat protein [Ovoidimarina sediminis]|uniref:tetratricopeptide repeat protein n=1 Tax=Ovoidimarina sediminis TaxID=3079856 RepID=UPI0029119391|nr:tetratricopeptide repeat protein [Rhodophyticola sp. MJ-SS7]MDU8944982.1 tetratricopeptide repeat protein [Rhodophyticola sp. MJ-SS7]